MPKYNGHKNWNHWNVSLWINNDEVLYGTAQDILKRMRGRRCAASIEMYRQLKDANVTHTPDGAPYSVSSIRAAMVEM